MERRAVRAMSKEDQLVRAACTLEVRDLRVLVTAGGSGIGRAIAERLLSAGAQVHVTDLVGANVESAVKANPGLVGSQGDASVVGDVDRVVADVVGQFKGLDLLVNNVGIAGPTGELDRLDEADVERTIDVNLKSHFHFLKRCLPLLKASERNPSVLAISSVAGRLGYGHRTPYAATKWAIVGLVKSLAIELGPQGIRANAILPGAVTGPRIDKVIVDRAQALGVPLEQMRQSFLSKISLRRMVEAEDVANLALFLASDLARNISGQAISVDGNVEYL